MKNAKGLALPMTLGLMVFCSMLGLGAIEYGGMQGQVAAKKEYSAASLWLADGAVELARQRLITTTTAFNSGTVSLSGNRSYIFDISGSDPYTVKATGTVGTGINQKSRYIRAIVTDVAGATAAALVYSGTEEHVSNSTAIKGDLPADAVQNTSLTTQSVFGISLAALEATSLGTRLPKAGYLLSR